MVKLFKTDGIRGKYKEDITLDLAFKLGMSLCNIGSNVIIGYDSRYSSLDLANEIKKGVFSKGNTCSIIGLCSTPKLAYYSKNLNCIGVMITASHNPCHDNGIKVYKCGEKISKYEEEKLEKCIYSIDIYETKLKELIKNKADKIVLDGAHGGASEILKNVFISPNFHLINCDYNGYDINDRCGALYPEKIRDYILTNNLDYGFSFDGDADRIIACDKKGNIYSGDYLAYLLSCYYGCDKVVLTKMTNKGIIEAFNKKGVEVLLCDSGDKNVYDMMSKYNVSIGAEASGHIINLLENNLGDAILHAINIMNILSKTDWKLHDFLNEIKLYESQLRNYYINISNDDLILLEKKLNDKFRNVYSYFRISGTEKCIRVFLQCRDENVLNDAFLFLEDEICRL